eukprot:12411314-Karenia_brevis.AAC.1
MPPEPKGRGTAKDRWNGSREERGGEEAGRVRGMSQKTEHTHSHTAAVQKTQTGRTGTET